MGGRLALRYHIYGSLWTTENIQTNNHISENILLSFHQFNRPPVSSLTVNNIVLKSMLEITFRILDTQLNTLIPFQAGDTHSCFPQFPTPKGHSHRTLELAEPVRLLVVLRGQHCRVQEHQHDYEPVERLTFDCLSTSSATSSVNTAIEERERERERSVNWSK